MKKVTNNDIGEAWGAKFGIFVVKSFLNGSLRNSWLQLNSNLN